MEYRLLFVAMLMAAGVLHAQTTDTVRQSMLDSIDAKMKMMKLKGIKGTGTLIQSFFNLQRYAFFLKRQETFTGLELIYRHPHQTDTKSV